MLTRLETQSRKKAKLTPYMDVMDFQLLLFFGLVLPLIIWLLSGITWKGTFWIPIAYTLWMVRFKVGKPPGYWQHWLSFQLRGKLWTCYSNSPIPPHILSTKLSALSNKPFEK